MIFGTCATENTFMLCFYSKVFETKNKAATKDILFASLLSLNHSHYVSHRSFSAKAGIAILKNLPSPQPIQSAKSDDLAGELIIDSRTDERMLSLHSSRASTPHSASPLQSAPVTPPPSPNFRVAQREHEPSSSLLPLELGKGQHSISASESSTAKNESFSVKSVDTSLVCRPASIDFGRFILSSGNKHIPLMSIFSVSKNPSTSPTVHSRFEIAYDYATVLKFTQERQPISPEIVMLFEQQRQYVVITVEKISSDQNQIESISVEKPNTDQIESFEESSSSLMVESSTADILPVFQAEISPVEFRLTCRVLQAVPFVGYIAINDIETAQVLLLSLHFNPRPPAYLEFPDLSQNGNLDLGLCYAEEDNVCKTASFRVVNLRDFPLRVLVSTNLRSQVLLQDFSTSSDSASEVNMQFILAANAEYSFKIAIKSSLTTDSRESGAIRSLKAGLKFDVFSMKDNLDVSEPLAQMTIPITAQIGRSIVRVRLPQVGSQGGPGFLKQLNTPLLIDFGVSQQPLSLFQVFF